MKRPAASVDGYLARVPAAQRETLGAILSTIRAHRDPELEEGIE